MGGGEGGEKANCTYYAITTRVIFAWGWAAEQVTSHCLLIVGHRLQITLQITIGQNP